MSATTLYAIVRPAAHGADSKEGLTMALDPPALLPISKDEMDVRFFTFLRPVTLTSDLSS